MCHSFLFLWRLLVYLFIGHGTSNQLRSLVVMRYTLSPECVTANYLFPPFEILEHRYVTRPMAHLP